MSLHVIEVPKFVDKVFIFFSIVLLLIMSMISPFIMLYMFTQKDSYKKRCRIKTCKGVLNWKVLIHKWWVELVK